MKTKLEISLLLTATLLSMVSSQCPWQQEIPELLSACMCSYNLGQELSVQCDMVEWPKLISALHQYALATPLDLLYVNNSTIDELKDNVFLNLRLHNVQLSGCKIKTVHAEAFSGQEESLKTLNFQDNELSEVPVSSLRKLKSLSLLDLSRNRIVKIQNRSFETLEKLATLKLSDNLISLEDDALKGLEGSLKNLNLKGTKQKDVPKAIQGMKTLAFLDLSQNSLRVLPGSNGNQTFEGLNSLTALNLERNLIQNLEENAFEGVKKTLSSLSLLNNLLPDFPTAAISTLKELRVLDIGFNLLTELPLDAFKGNPSITLLALDGNPLATIPFEALSHLNNTLRGLSLGGRFLHCDCRLAWVINWIRNGDLQVTSRERNPQFCGSPPKFRDLSFYSIQPEDLSCSKKDSPSTTTSTSTTTTTTTMKNPIEVVEAPKPIGVATVVSADLDDLVAAQPELLSSTSTSTKSPSTKSTITTSTTISTSSSTTRVTSTTTTDKSTTTKPKPKSPLPPVWKTSQRPPMVLGFPSKNREESKEVLVKDAYRQDNSVIIKWGSETANILGFRVVYRLFGDKSFKQGPPLEASEREFKIKNVPSQECIIVCVVSLEEIHVTPESVPHSQCREVRTVSSVSSNMDKITIAASAAICGTIFLAVIIFIAASRRRSKKIHELNQQKLGVKHGIPISGLPVNCCTMPGSPAEPLSSLAALNAFNNAKDWDQISAYSAHSQRPRMYSLDQPASLDEMRSHYGPKGKPRSVADGQSQHSFSNQSGRYLTATAFPNNLLASRQDLRQSRQSLSMQSERMSSRMAPHHAPPPHSVISQQNRRSRPRSRSRDHNRPSSRYSTAGSTHTLNNYCDNSDNWTDHDMEIYMARNPTTRNGLVPL